MVWAEMTKTEKQDLQSSEDLALSVGELVLACPSCVARQISFCKMGQQECPLQDGCEDDVAQAGPPGQSQSQSQSPSFVTSSPVYQVPVMCQAVVHKAACKDSHAICPGHSHF